MYREVCELVAASCTWPYCCPARRKRWSHAATPRARLQGPGPWRAPPPGTPPPRAQPISLAVAMEEAGHNRPRCSLGPPSVAEALGESPVTLDASLFGLYQGPPHVAGRSQSFGQRAGVAIWASRIENIRQREPKVLRQRVRHGEGFALPKSVLANAHRPEPGLLWGTPWCLALRMDHQTLYPMCCSSSTRACHHFPTL